MTKYIFDDNQSDAELRRMRLIESALDVQTCHLLEQTGVATGWKCLEVGAGGGSILRWLGNRVGVTGRVVGVDKNTAYLKSFAAPPYEILDGNVLTVRGSGGFDLIHARYVLIHNRDAADILAHLKNLLNPGGHLVLEEPDFEAAEWIDSRYGAAGNRVNHATCAMFRGLSLDPGYGKRMPMAVSQMGLSLARVDARSHLENGTRPVAAMMAASTMALRDKYTATGEASDADVVHYIDGALDPASWSNYYSTVGIIATAAR